MLSALIQQNRRHAKKNTEFKYIHSISYSEESEQGIEMAAATRRTKPSNRNNPNGRISSGVTKPTPVTRRPTLTSPKPNGFAGSNNSPSSDYNNESKPGVVRYSLIDQQFKKMLLALFRKYYPEIDLS